MQAELIELDDALVLFRVEDSVKARLVELRFIAGLSMEEAAAIMGSSKATAGWHWAYARGWLLYELK